MMTPSLRIGSLTEPSNIRLVSQVEIDEVPVPGEPSKPNTCKSEGDIKQFRPYPLARFCPASESVENYNQSAHGGDHSENIDFFFLKIAAPPEFTPFPRPAPLHN